MEDDIGDRIASLFEGRVGPSPKNQDQLRELLINADDRISNKIPPGFEDSKKDGSFFDGSIRYDRKYGDIILWRQSISYIKDRNIKYAIFITDDNKKDWWEVSGPTTLGPHPSLLQEMRTESGVELFWIYKTDQFLKYAGEYITAEGVTEEVVQQAKDMSEIPFIEEPSHPSPTENYISNSNMFSLEQKTGLVEIYSNMLKEFQTKKNYDTHHMKMCVRKWISKFFEGTLFEADFFPGFIVIDNSYKIGFSVFLLDSIENNGEKFKEYLFNNLNIFNTPLFDNFYILVVTPPNMSIYDLTTEEIKSVSRLFHIDSIFIGSIENDLFFPHTNLQLFRE